MCCSMRARARTSRECSADCRAARGQGLGRRLVRECIAFARARGYRKLALWTQSNLAAARAIYKAEGFTLAGTEKHASFGVKLTGEYWELNLKGRELKL